MNKIREWWKQSKNVIVYENEIVDLEFTLADEDGEFKVPLKITRCLTLGTGIWYHATVSDLSVNCKTWRSAVSSIIEHLYRDSPLYYRLRDRNITKKEKCTRSYGGTIAVLKEQASVFPFARLELALPEEVQKAEVKVIKSINRLEKTYKEYIRTIHGENNDKD